MWKWMGRREMDFPNVVDEEGVGERQGFYIDEYELDKDHWTEGFVTMVGDQEYEE
jgi:hypothetical protein